MRALWATVPGCGAWLPSRTSARPRGDGGSENGADDGVKLARKSNRRHHIQGNQRQRPKPTRKGGRKNNAINHLIPMTGWLDPTVSVAREPWDQDDHHDGRPKKSHQKGVHLAAQDFSNGTIDHEGQTGEESETDTCEIGRLNADAVCHCLGSALKGCDHLFLGR